VLTPAVVVETDIYSNADIAAWDKADAFRPGEHTQLKTRLKMGRGPRVPALSRRQCIVYGCS
jgi:hypothetical protein